MGLGSRGVHRLVVSTAIACESYGSAAVGEALDTMDVHCRIRSGSRGRLGGGAVVDIACIRGRFVLHVDCGLVLPSKVEGNPLCSLGVAHFGLDFCCMAHGVPLVKP